MEVVVILDFMHERYINIFTVLMNKKLVSEKSFSYEIYFKTWYYMSFSVQKTKQFILQDCGGGYLGFMDEQVHKIKSSIRNDLLIQNSH